MWHMLPRAHPFLGEAIDFIRLHTNRLKASIITKTKKAMSCFAQTISDN